MMQRTRITLRKLALCAVTWLFCVAGLIFKFPRLLEPRGHDWRLAFFYVWIAWQLGQWLGAIALPFYSAVIVVRHKQGP